MGWPFRPRGVENRRNRCGIPGFPRLRRCLGIDRDIGSRRGAWEGGRALGGARLHALATIAESTRAGAHRARTRWRRKMSQDVVEMCRTPRGGVTPGVWHPSCIQGCAFSNPRSPDTRDLSRPGSLALFNVFSRQAEFGSSYVVYIGERCSSGAKGKATVPGRAGLTSGRGVGRLAWEGLAAGAS